MDLTARVDVNCGRKERLTENRTPISHLAKAGATKMSYGQASATSWEHKTTITLLFFTDTVQPFP